jgi:hypothetical protein
MEKGEAIAKKNDQVKRVDPDLYIVKSQTDNHAYKVFVNGTEVTYTTLPCSNSTHIYLYFNYTHSTQNVTIIPELPSPLILYLFMITAPLALIGYRRKRSPCHTLLETIHTY